MKLKFILFSLIFGLSFSSCGTLAFNYKHYVLNLEEEKLAAHNPEDDLPLKVCKKDEAGYHCVTLLIDEFYRLKAAHEKALLRIDELQRNCDYR